MEYPHFNRRYIFNPGPFSSQLCWGLLECTRISKGITNCIQPSRRSFTLYESFIGIRLRSKTGWCFQAIFKTYYSQFGSFFPISGGKHDKKDWHHQVENWSFLKYDCKSNHAIWEANLADSRENQSRHSVFQEAMSLTRSALYSLTAITCNPVAQSFMFMLMIVFNISHY